MIARIFIPILLAIVLPDLYFEIHYLRCRPSLKWWQRLLWWSPTIVLTAYSICLASIHNFVPDDLRWLNVYLFLVGLIIVPKAVFALCSGIGWYISHRRRLVLNYGNAVGTVLVVFFWIVLLYGSTIGPRQLTVKHENLYFRDLPKGFEGYKIVQFTDMHLGTFYRLNRSFPARVADSIMAQRADMIVFTGDLQNLMPKELLYFRKEMSSLRAKDGVFSILGNHDYSEYVKAAPNLKKQYERQTQAEERNFGWTLLMNENRVIRRGQDSLVIAGEENYGTEVFPHNADLNKTVKGIKNNAFMIMLQHEPGAWRGDLEMTCSAQLTLSGHTHGGQIDLFGLRPTHLEGQDDRGLYMKDNKMLYVSSGVGGVVPFRFGVKPEIVVITLHRIK